MASGTITRAAAKLEDRPVVVKSRKNPRNPGSNRQTEAVSREGGVKMLIPAGMHGIPFFENRSNVGYRHRVQENNPIARAASRLYRGRTADPRESECCCPLSNWA